MKKQVSKHAHELAEKQRYQALVNAYKTIKVFAVASCNPHQFKEFERTERYLKNMYKPKNISEPKIEIPEGGFRSPRSKTK